MHIFYCLGLLLLVYLAPACALYPRIVLSSRTVVTIPFVSIAFIVVIQKLLVLADAWSHSKVLLVSGGLLVIAVVRLLLLFRRDGLQELDWPPTHRVLLLMCLLFGVYWASQLGTSGFDTDDEIYSWNLWAVQHYLGHEIDFYYTQSPYPQLFPILVSWCYQLLGSIELQLPTKAMFAIFPVALWGAIAVMPKEASLDNAIRSVIFMVLLTAAIGRYFSSGLADPLMAASLIVAVYAAIQYTREPDRLLWLILSVVCAAVALHTKQAALIWVLFSFPMITVMAVIRRRLPAVTLVGAALLIAFGLFWIFGAGSGFQENYGVINASQQGRGLLDQLFFAVRTHGVGHPLVTVFALVACISVMVARCQRDILILFALPALLVWLLFGAYSLRLGIHVVAAFALLLAASEFALPKVLGGGKWSSTASFVRRYARPLTLAIVVLMGSASIVRINRNIDKIGPDFSPVKAGQNMISLYFGKDAKFVFEELYDHQDLLLWVPSNYIYGIFYGHTPMIRPAFREMEDYNLQSLVDEIREHRPDYLFDSGQRVAYGPGAALLRELAENQCPQLFEIKAGPPNRFGYTVYRLHEDEAMLDRCAVEVRQSMTDS